MEVAQRQRDAEALVHTNYGRAWGRALDAQAGRGAPEANQRAAAAMLAEGSATANRNSQTINRAEANAGRAAMEQIYGQKTAADKSAVLSGRVVGYDLPKGFGGTKDVASLVENGQILVRQVNQDTYASRGNVSAIGPSGHYMEKVAGREVESKEKLASHLLHVKAAIDAGVDRKHFDRAAADSLYQRFERSVFDPEAQKRGSHEYSGYAKAQTPRMQQEISKDVTARYEAQNKTVERAKGRELDPANVARAEDFRKLSPVDGVKKHPDLASAYANVQAAQAQAASVGMNPQQQAVISARAREAVAQKIEQGGSVPDIKMRQEVVQQKTQERTAER